VRFLWLEQTEMPVGRREALANLLGMLVRDRLVDLGMGLGVVVQGRCMVQGVAMVRHDHVVVLHALLLLQSLLLRRLLRLLCQRGGCEQDGRAGHQCRESFHADVLL
jgi:hypothetical protein